MNKDIRLKVTFPNHKKTIKLIHLIGSDGFYSLVQLWCYVAQNHPKGILNDYDKYDLEIAARWTGEQGEFTKAVTRKDINFVKKIAKGFEINGWEEHNPYVFHADERSEKARQAAKARWEPIKDKGLSDASSIEVALPQASVSNAPSPTPSPLPEPTPINKDIYTVFDFWNSQGITKHKTIDKSKPSISASLKEYSEDEIIRAITNYKKILNDSTYYWTHKWTLKEFLQRGMDKFRDENNPFDNYKADKKGGAKIGKHTGLNEKDYSEGINPDGTF